MVWIYIQFSKRIFGYILKMDIGYLMPVGHPLFLFSVGERTTYASDVNEHIGLSTVRRLGNKKYPSKWFDGDET